MKSNCTIIYKILTLILMSIICVFLFAGCGNKNDAMDYVSVSFTGYNGNGKVDLNVDGILVQSVAELEDSFDAETMMETELLHKERFTAMQEWFQKMGASVLPIGAGCCTVCTKCTYPDSPCRFPEKKISSMEAFGMLVLEVCKANGMEYFYGANTIAYTSCFLLK